MKFSFIFLFCFCWLANISLAQVTEESKLFPDTTEVNIVVIKDARLDILDTRPEALRLAELAAAKANEVKSKNNVEVFNPIKAGNKTVTGSILQVPGFRVMIYNGPDRAMATKIKTEFNKRFPTMRSYMNYNVPNYKIKVGDFTDRKDANKFLKSVQAIIPSAVVLPDIVTQKNIIIQ
jgi:hypothetical protein